MTLTVSSSLKTAWIWCGGWESTVPSAGENLTRVAWAEGRAMTLEQAIEYALQDETLSEEARGSSSNVAPE